MNNTANPSLIPEERKGGFHPKRFLKNLQQKLYACPSSYLAFCFLVPVILMFGVYLTRALHPFGDGTPLVLDLNAQYVYFFEGLRNLVYGEADSFLYSFSRSLGGEFMGMYAYYLASPLSYLVALFPQDRIQEAILTIILLKTGLSGFTFGFYLHKHTRKVNKLAVITFSVLYALSAYAVCQQSNTMWIDALVWLPIFTYALEELMLNRKYKLYVLSLSIILISNYYIGYMVCIYAVLYFFYYYFSRKAEDINVRSEKLHFIRTGARFAIFSILSAAIAAFMLIAAYYSLGFGKSDFSTPNWSPKANFEIIDMLVKFLPGSYDTFEPSGIPFLYCGILTLIMLPIYFVSKKITPREKVASLAVIAFFLFSLIFNPLDLVWHGFSTPNWLNGRYSFMFCFFLLILAYKAFGNLGEVSEKLVLGISAFLILFVAVAEKMELESFINSNNKLLTFGCIWFSIVFIVALLVLLCLRIRLKSEKTRRCISAILAAVVCIEVFANGVVCFIKINDDVLFTKYSSYQNYIDGIRPVVEDVKEYDGGFYRMEKLHHRQKNDNFALGIRGLSNSTSTLNADAIQLINYFGYSGRAHLTQYNGGTPFSDSLLGVKYVIDKSSSEKLNGIYEPIDEIENEDYRVYRNPYALSLAYGVSKDLLEFDMEDHTTFFSRFNSLLPTMLGEEGDIDIFKPVSNLSTHSGNCKEVEMMTSVKYTAPADSTGSFSMTYTAPYSGNYYFYTPVTSSIPKNVDLKINSGTKFSYLEKDTNHIVNAGYFEKGSTIKFTFYISEGGYLTINTKSSCLWYLDTETYNSAMQRMLEQPQLIIDDASEDDNIFGTMTTTSSDQTVLTTIPYDEGWQVYVDGERVEIYETLDALMAFDVAESGDHSIEMKYMPAVYKLGALLSMIAIIAFILIIVIDFILKKTVFKRKPLTVAKDIWVLEDFDAESAPVIKDSAKEDTAEAVDSTENS